MPYLSVNSSDVSSSVARRRFAWSLRIFSPIQTKARILSNSKDPTIRGSEIFSTNHLQCLLSGSELGLGHNPSKSVRNRDEYAVLHATMIHSPSFTVFVLFGTLCSVSLLLPQPQINLRVSPGRFSRVL